MFKTFPKNEIFVGGDFTHAGKPGAEVECKNFVRFDAFNYSLASIPLNLNGPITSMALSFFGMQNRILISGNFTNVQVNTPHLPCINSGTPIPETLTTNYANYSLYFDTESNNAYAGGPMPNSSETESLVLSTSINGLVFDSIIYKATNRIVTTRNGLDWHDVGSNVSVAPNSVVFFYVDEYGIHYTGHSNDSPNILHRSIPVGVPDSSQSVKFVLPNARFRSKPNRFKRLRRTDSFSAITNTLFSPSKKSATRGEIAVKAVRRR